MLRAIAGNRGSAGWCSAPVCIRCRERLPLWAYHALTVAGIVRDHGFDRGQRRPVCQQRALLSVRSRVHLLLLQPVRGLGYALFSLVAVCAAAETDYRTAPVEPTGLVIFAGCSCSWGFSCASSAAGRGRWRRSSRRQATTDALTGLLNRRGSSGSPTARWRGRCAPGSPFSLLIGDLDHFKSVNDKLGHMGGDMALERVAAGLRRRAAGDRLGRPHRRRGVRGADARDRQGERARSPPSASAGASAGTFRGRPVELTMSIGVATYPRRRRVLGAAPRRRRLGPLRGEGRAGRDQVVAFDDDDLEQAIT